MTEPSRDPQGRYAKFWFGIASFAATLLLLFLAVSSCLGYVS